MGVVTNADPDKVQRDADFRFSRVHQYASESVSGFYDRYLQEVGTWTEADNIVEAMQLAQSYRYDGRVMADVIISTRDIDASAYVTQYRTSRRINVTREKQTKTIVVRV